MFKLGQTVKFKQCVKGKTNIKDREMTVVATGGGSTTFKSAEGTLICLKDEDAAKKIG